MCKVGELLGIFEVLPPVVVHSGETGQKFRQLLLQCGVVGFLRHVATVKTKNYRKKYLKLQSIYPLYSI